jgi:hypothetical protein
MILLCRKAIIMDLSNVTGNVFGTLVGLALGVLANALVIWILANFVVNLGDKSPFKKCVICALALGLVNMVAFGALFIPIPLVNFGVALLIWYKGSVAAIEGSLEATKGGFTILLICTIISIAITIGNMAAAG